jgi:hypothetical protein
MAKTPKIIHAREIDDLTLAKRAKEKGYLWQGNWKPYRRAGLWKHVLTGIVETEPRALKLVRLERGE